MLHVRTGWAIGVTVLAVASLVAGAPAVAAPDRVTRGEAEAIFEGYGTGGQALRSNGATVSGAPADFGEVATIRPFDPPGGANGRHFCAEDWHVIVLALIDGGDASYTREAAEAFLSTVTLTFTLDGAPLSVTRTALKRYVDAELVDLETAYWVQEGVVLSPADLTVGEHELVVDAVISDDPPISLTFEATFVIDAPGTGTCL
jgi:hypothetical protein